MTRSHPVDIVVVDNGSTDGTSDEAAKAGARVVHEPMRGYGAACRAGSLAATGDVLVFLDADGSFDPADIEQVVGPIRNRGTDLSLGSRTLGSGIGSILPHQRWGNWLATRLLRVLYGVQVTDLGPFRAIRRDVLLALGMEEMTYGWPIEMMIRAHQAGLRLSETPVSYRPRRGGRSKVSGTVIGSLRAGLRILWTVIRCGLRSSPEAVPND